MCLRKDFLFEEKKNQGKYQKSSSFRLIQKNYESYTIKIDIFLFFFSFELVRTLIKSSVGSSERGNEF